MVKALPKSANRPVNVIIIIAGDNHLASIVIRTSKADHLASIVQSERRTLGLLVCHVLTQASNPGHHILMALLGSSLGGFVLASVNKKYGGG